MNNTYTNDKHWKHLFELHIVSKLAEERYHNQDLDETDKYIATGLIKINKIASGLLHLYPQLDQVTALEFTIGISLRSALMDSIQVLHLVHLLKAGEAAGHNANNVAETLRDCCFKYNCDGTQYIVNQIHSEDGHTDEEKQELFETCIGLFQRAFKNIPTDGSKPTFDDSYTVKLNKLYKQAESSKISRYPIVYGLYCHYSKYDHLSHWTLKADQIDHSTKIEYLQTGIELILMHLRDMLLISRFNSYIKLNDLYNRLTAYLDENIFKIQD